MSSDSDSDPEYSLPIRKLRNELETVLKSDIDMNGNYYAAVEHTFNTYGARDPQLNIEGIGPIGLPLSVENAKKIIEVASKAPYGNGEQTVVDVQVRDTWQIEPSKVQFDGPDWNYDLTLNARSVYDLLGVSHSPTSSPTCEFYKLLLYEAGSHFLPHQDSEKAEGMFATMVIVLPSAYEGGQVHLQHGSRQDVIDVSSNWEGVSILGWYTDVMHEVKPVTSGYRLALSYNLIHTSMESPVPHLTPEDAGMARLKAALKKWNTSKIAYKSVQETLLVYILDHEYSHSNLQRGVRSLKGKDSSMVACLREAGEELGITLLLGNLEYYLSGCGRLEPGYESGGPDDGQTPHYFSQVGERKLTINHLVDTEGHAIEVLSKIKIKGHENFIPKAYFTSVQPKNAEHEPYYGNDGNSLQHWYRQTALVLLRKKDAHKILYDVGGADYAVPRLRKLTGPPSKYDKRLAKRLLRDLAGKWELNVGALRTIADCSLNWKDSRLWLNCISNNGRYWIYPFGVDRLLEGFREFGFATVKECFEKIMVSRQSLKDRLHLVDAMPAHSIESDQEHVEDWCKVQPLHVFETLSFLEIGDVPALVKFAIEEGSIATLNVIFAELKDTGISFEIVAALMKALLEHKASIIGRLSGSSQQDFDEITCLCINMATDAWFREFTSMMDRTRHGRKYEKQAYISPSERDKHIGRIISILNYSFSAKQPEACAKLIQRVMEIEDKRERLHSFFVPLAHQISDHVRPNGLGLAEAPYSTLLATIIGEYCGIFPSINKKLANLREIGCGCSSCTSVDAFLQDVTLENQDFELSYLRRMHIETQLMKAEDLVYFLPLQKEQANPHGLQIRKLPLTLLTHEWQRRVADTNKFLDRIGTAEELSALPENKYGEVQQILTKIERAIRGDVMG